MQDDASIIASAPLRAAKRLDLPPFRWTPRAVLPPTIQFRVGCEPFCVNAPSGGVGPSRDEQVPPPRLARHFWGCMSAPASKYALPGQGWLAAVSLSRLEKRSCLSRCAPLPAVAASSSRQAGAPAKCRVGRPATHARATARHRARGRRAGTGARKRTSAVGRQRLGRNTLRRPWLRYTPRAKSSRAGLGGSPSPRRATATIRGRPASSYASASPGQTLGQWSGPGRARHQPAPSRKVHQHPQDPPRTPHHGLLQSVQRRSRGLACKTRQK